jgi:phage shock protein PspC (stress-responsive transcriptional regulator)
MAKRLYRSRTNRILTGLCGGLGEYFDIDPVLVRIVWLIIPGLNLLVYLIGSLIVPDEVM